MTFYEDSLGKARVRSPSWSVQFRRLFPQKRYVWSSILLCLLPFLVLRLVIFYNVTVLLQPPARIPVDVTSEELLLHTHVASDAKLPIMHDTRALILPDEDTWISHDEWINHIIQDSADESSHKRLPKEKEDEKRNRGGQPARLIDRRSSRANEMENFGLPRENEKDGQKKIQEEREANEENAAERKRVDAQQRDKLKLQEENLAVLKKKKAEEKQKVDEQKKAAEQREVEENKVNEEKVTAKEREAIEEKRKEEEHKRAAEQREADQKKAEEEKAAAEEKRKEEERKRAAEQKEADQKKAEEEKAAEEKRKEEEHKRAAEQREADQKKAEEEKAAEERAAEKKRKEEDHKRTAEQREADQKKADEEKAAGEEREAEEKQVREGEQDIAAEESSEVGVNQENTVSQEKEADENRKEEVQKIADEHRGAEDKETEEKKPAEERQRTEDQNRPEVDEKSDVKYEDSHDDQTQQVTPAGQCDLFDGGWEYDPEGPLYTNSTCSHIGGDQNCIANGRPDSGYLYWKWKPRDCDLPRFDAGAFLEAFKGKAIGFVGDSLARNQMQSLLCMLSQVEEPNKLQEHGGVVKWLYPQYQVHLVVVFSPYLLKFEEAGSVPGVEKSQPILHLDVLDTLWTAMLPDLDIIVLSIGQWYFKSALYKQQDEVVGCHYCPSFNFTEMGFHEPYRDALRQVLEKVVSEFKGIAIMSTFAIEHFEHGPWQDGGDCRREKPLEQDELALFPGMHDEMHDIVMGEFNRIESDKNRLHENVHLDVLDVTKVSLLRADGHPGPYRRLHPFRDRDPTEWILNDCLHWCLPGPVDTWNQLLVKIAHRYL